MRPLISRKHWRKEAFTEWRKGLEYAVAYDALKEVLLENVDERSGDWRTIEERAADIAQAAGLQEQAGQGGLRFKAYLPPRLAA